MIVDDLSAELKQERARQHLASTTGLLSKSADSDTLIVDLIKDHRLVDREENRLMPQEIDEGLTPAREGGDGELASQREGEDAKQGEEMDEGNTKMNTTQGAENAQIDDFNVKDGSADKSGLLFVWLQLTVTVWIKLYLVGLVRCA